METSDVPATRLRHYQNAKVTVHYSPQSYTDTGIVTYMDATWIELTKDNGERLLIPIVAIRLIKLLDVTKREGDAAVLLRPASGEPPQIEAKEEKSRKR
jgi:hypothetical protein